MARCKRCGRTIYWDKDENGRYIPCDDSEFTISHFETCPERSHNGTGASAGSTPTRRTPSSGGTRAMESTVPTIRMDQKLDEILERLHRLERNLHELLTSQNGPTL